MFNIMNIMSEIILIKILLPNNSCLVLITFKPVSLLLHVSIIATYLSAFPKIEEVYISMGLGWYT